MPEPQMPFGGRSPMVRYRRRLSAPIFTLQIAPGSARMPEWLTAPSSAGPAAPAPMSRKSRQPSTSSPFVPMSRNSARSSRVSRSVSSSPPVMSPPR